MAKETAAQEAPDQDDFVQRAFDTAYRLREEKEAFQKRQNGNRTVLRAMRDSGELTEDEVKHLEELYPTRQRKGGDDDGDSSE